MNNQNSSSSIKQEKLKPKDIKQRIDEIAKRRAELKKLAKKDEIDKKLRKSCDNEERKEESEPFEEIKDQLQPSQDKDKVCIICYDFNNLYVSKCGHYACKGCWEEWLKRYLECPKCRTRVRRIQILPLSQEGLFKK